MALTDLYVPITTPLFAVAERAALAWFGHSERHVEERKVLARVIYTELLAAGIRTSSIRANIPKDPPYADAE